MYRYHPQRVRVLIADDHVPSTDRVKEMVAANFEYQSSGNLTRLGFPNHL